VSEIHVPVAGGKAVAGTVHDVRSMYQAFPYPSPTVGDTLIEDVAMSFLSFFGNDPLTGKRILDAGCGTGHRLLGVAQNYPDAHFVGVDMTPASLDVARTLMRKHQLHNVEFHCGDLTKFESAPFDVIVSTGVIHHLENPCEGQRVLASLLAPEGILAVWHYHPLGEHRRLVDRELLLTLWDRSSGLDTGVQIMESLGLRLQVQQYGSSAAQASKEVSQLNIDVDAYLHPIVNAYRFDEAVSMFRDCAQLDWAAINNVNLPGVSKLLDLRELERGDFLAFCQSVDELFADERLRARFRELDAADKMRVLELKLRPTGFTIVGGRGESYRSLEPRLQGNVIDLAADVVRPKAPL
jgi:SAM-dependent methyltransferase